LTKSRSALYENFEVQQAWALAQRFEFYFTLTRGSWLNMIEIEFSALSRSFVVPVSQAAYPHSGTA
jgi:hypothetical protein